MVRVKGKEEQGAQLLSVCSICNSTQSASQKPTWSWGNDGWSPCVRGSWTVTATQGVSRRSPRPGPNSALKLRQVLRALPPSAPGLTQDGPHFTLCLPAAAVPFLMPFIVNFTITNLRYTEDMGNLGSEIFNATERNLQQLVRAPQF